MKGIVLTALMIVGILLFAGTAIGLSYTKYDEVTTTVYIEDGITCTINDKEVRNGDRITIPTGNDSLRIHAVSNYVLPIGIAGKWCSETRTITEYLIDANDMEVSFGHGTFEGKLMIGFTAEDSDIAGIVLKFTIGEGITVKCGSDEIKDGDEYRFPNDSKIDVTTNDGQRHDVKYKGSWSNEYGMSGGASGEELGSSITIDIVDMMYFSDGHGTMEIHI